MYVTPTHLGNGKTHLAAIGWWKNKETQRYDGNIDNAETVKPVAKGAGGANEHVEGRAM